MRIVALSGGVGGARFLRGLLAATGAGNAAGSAAGAVGAGGAGSAGARNAEITAIGNTADDISLFGLHVSPDLDTVLYTLGGGINEEQGWGRDDETFVVQSELAEYGVQPQWFRLGDRDIATHIVRTQMLNAGYPLSAVTEALGDRWGLPIRLLPMTDDPVETHVVVDDPDVEGGRRAVHFQEYWVRLRAEPDAHAIVPVGADKATPAPGVLDAIAQADVILLPPSNPVVSIGPILAVPGIRDALREAVAPVVGVSPIVGGAPVRGHADRVLAAIGVRSTAGAVALHYGARSNGGLIDGWLVDEVDGDAVPEVTAAGIACEARALLMTDVAAAGRIAAATLALAERLRG